MIPASDAGVAEVHLLPGARGAVDLLVEVPHGATDPEDYRRVADALAGLLPADLDHFFHVNTDVAAWELGLAVAERVRAARPGLGILLVRARLPRTFVDVNRVLDLDPAAYAGGVTPGIPPYVSHPDDLAHLHALYRRYRAVVDAAWAALGPAGIGFTPHTYAPRTVGIEQVDADIVRALHRVYAPDLVDTWPLRPELDLITVTPDGADLSPRPAVERLTASCRARGIEVAANDSYTLHPATLAHTRAVAHPGRVLCLEVRRDLLVHAWTPFAPMHADPARVARFAEPLAEGLLTVLPA